MRPRFTRQEGRPPRRRREDLVRPLASLCAVLIVVVVVQGAAQFTTSRKASRAAAAAVRNADRIGAVERLECGRVQDLRDSVNETSGTIYILLGAVRVNAGRAGRPANAREYRILGRLPRYQPPTDCAAAQLPGYDPGPAVPFSELPRRILITVLPRSVVERILGRG